MPVVLISGVEIFYRMRRSSRAKHLRMEYTIKGINLVAPKGLSNQIIIKFIFEQKSWLLKRACSHLNHEATHWRWPTTFVSGETFPFMGEKLIIDLEYLTDEMPPFIIGKTLKITVPLKQKITTLNQYVKQQIINWLKLQAKNHVKRLVSQYSQQLGRKPSGVTIKLQKRRWGSCGIHDHIYINWLLMLAPLPVLSYVVLHECCHLFYRNHGSKFWNLVKKHMPEYKEQESWLRNNSGLIAPP